MRLSKILFVPAALFLLASAACTTSNTNARSEENRRLIDREYGVVGPQSNPKAFAMNGRNGSGFAMFRGYSEKPAPDRFGSVVPEVFENTLVVDFGIDMKIVDRFPLYRIGMDPTRIPDVRVDLWPSHVRIDSSDGVLAARLPERRVPGPDGMIWSDWTYCSDCFSLDAVSSAQGAGADTAFAALDKAYRAAERPGSGRSVYAGRATFTPAPGVGILIGVAAQDMALRASAIVRKSRTALDQGRPARDAHTAIAREFSTTVSPLSEINSLCGTYAANSAPAVSAAEKARVDAFVECGLEVIERFDGQRRHAEIESLRAREAQIAEEGGLRGLQMIDFPTHREEVVRARAVLEQAIDSYNRAAPTGSARAELPSQGRVSVGLSGPEIEDITQSALGRAAGQADLDRGSRVPAARASEAEISRLATLSPEEPANRSIYFVSRLLPDGAMMSIGEKQNGCIEGLSCETGSIVSLIAATAWCDAPGKDSRTVSGWGVVVQRYLPRSAAEEKRILAGDGKSRIHVVTSDDKTALSEGMKSARAITRGADQIYFASYEEFYGVNTTKKGCSDQWRDAARNPVLNNPEAALR